MRGRRGIIWLIVVFAFIVSGVVGIYWDKLQSGIASKPVSLGTTIKGDPRTSRAFTWHTASSGSQGKVQVTEGAKADPWDGENVLTFTAESANIISGEGKPQSVHKAEAIGLKPGTTYVYRVGNGEDEGWSEPAIFVTETAEPDTFSFINVTDSQGVTEADFTLWGRTLDQAFATFPDARLIVHNGDFTEEPDNEKGWESFFGQAAKWLVSVPLMPVTGNHDEVEGNAERFTSHFNVPDNGADGSIQGTSYSFDYGYAHFIVLNTESNIKRQTEWLQEDLANNDKPWVIAAMHRPAYGGNTNKKVEDWVEVFDQFGVDLVLQGHNHEYSRSYPVRNGQIVPEGEGPVYVVTNAAGSKFNELKKNKFYHAVHFQNYKQMFAGITVSEHTLSYQAYDVDGTLQDQFVLNRE
ncbi:purple acid phosphatase family protein [Paenibacillus popilliae]|uniref:Predicted phosphohydrolase n=1 Tax=Paenibacillus popilliae ATCC 14706 TaxID=1212764 RepID=M9M127_PAEPP|nr:metallophosphoesterase family protein [Paenibacillus popilliae]GAC40763.1 predicted phosphohydrolase [Paenibacillus popilliae ATCC 14706]